MQHSDFKLVPDSQDQAFARQVHQHFAGLPGASAIATEFALAHLSAVLRIRKPKSAIEYGAGIGTITYALLHHPNAPDDLIVTEDNAFCLEQLAINLGPELADRYRVVSDMPALEAVTGQRDLVIFDGGFFDPRETRYLGDGSVCFIEGSRKVSRIAVVEELAKRGLDCRLDNYHRGYRYFAFDWVPSKETGRKRLKFRWRKIKKGCHVGLVTGSATPKT